MEELRLSVFEGPLEVLLQLIERQELDITAISLAAVTEQYLDYITGLGGLDPDRLADFLVMAARLILLKSRRLLPAPPAREEPEEESGEELAQLLAEYKRFKAAAQELRDLEGQGRRLYGRLAPVSYLPSPPPLEGVTLDALMSSLKRALTRSARLPEAPLERQAFSITDKVEEIRQGLARSESLAFGLLLAACRSRVEMIVSFLALLELLRRAEVQVRQEEAFGEIYIEPAES
ncbi:MAG: segregation/condensation protein A [Chloroflexi bacterium]|nr:segregation/condensation protein A [Chloroflexota bacterium]